MVRVSGVHGIWAGGDVYGAFMGGGLSVPCEWLKQPSLARRDVAAMSSTGSRLSRSSTWRRFTSAAGLAAVLAFSVLLRSALPGTGQDTQDCLYLNVFTPPGSEGSQPARAGAHLARQWRQRPRRHKPTLSARPTGGDVWESTCLVGKWLVYFPTRQVLSG